ncbi:MAG: hypothetical protein M3014_07620 [Chloroflexota bacterium]|nr:hypothetical protein [Chloroflexota bacterium]
MPKEEGTAHGRHYTDDEREADEGRNHNQSTGRRHFEEEGQEKAGGHSDRWATDSAGQQHEFSHKGGEGNEDIGNKPQDEGRKQGEGQGEGGHEGGRHKHNSK